MTKFEEEVKPIATVEMKATGDGNEINFHCKTGLSDYLLSKGNADLYLKSQLQQQALPVVPECMAEFITKVKKADNNLTFAFNSKFDECPAKYWNKAIVWRLNNPDEFARAWLDGYTVEKSDKCMVKLGALYFKCWNDVDAVFIIDDQPGAYESAFVFKKREDAEKVAQLVGGRVVKS